MVSSITEISGSKKILSEEDSLIHFLETIRLFGNGFT